MSAVADKLREARALIEPEGAWVHRHYGIDKNGRALAAVRLGALGYCAVGAIAAVNGVRYPHSDMEGLYFLSKAIGGNGNEADVLIWNDRQERTQAEVLAAFDKAIELAEAQS